MYTLKKNCERVLILGLIFGVSVLSFSAPTTEIPTTIPDDSSSSEESDELTLYRLARDVNEEGTDLPTTTPSNIVLQPNVAGALDVGQGLLVPLVPVIDSNAHNDTTQITPVKASLLPVAVESVTDNAKPEIRRSLEDMDVAEDIVFRPLFRYRQEERQEYSRDSYYRPYIYAYKKPNYDDY